MLVPVVDVCRFPSLRLAGDAESLLRNALRFHLTYHSSLSLHANHLLFLHSYVFGLFALFASPRSMPVFAIGTLLFIAFAIWLIRVIGIWVLPYALWLAALARLACEVVWSWSGGIPPITSALISLAVILVSFVAQLIGHALFEEFVAPPSLCHGFLAAPPLEYVCLLLRLGLLPRLNALVSCQAAALRARAALQACESQRVSDAAMDLNGLRATIRRLLRLATGLSSYRVDITT